MKRALVLSLSLGAVIASAAQAQGSVPRGPVLHEVGSCAARQSPRLARSLMATEMGTREELDRARQIFQGNDACYDSRMVLSSRIGEIRGTVAEALLERDEAALAALRAMPSRPAVRAPLAQGRAFVAAYGACLADAEPAKSVALLAAAPSSPAELEAFMAFGDTLNDCMPMEAAYRIDRFDVRNHIAARLYRIAYATQPEPSDA